MKIVNIIRSVDPNHGGTVSACRSFHRLLIELGHESKVVSLSCGFDIDHTETGIGNCGNNYGFSLKFISRISKFFKDCDLVFVHGMWQFHGVLALFYKYFYKFDLIYIPHGMASTYFDQFKLKKIKKNIYWHLIESKIVKHSKHIVFMGRGEIKSSARSLMLLCYRKQIIIPPVFEKNVLANNKKPVLTDELRILIIAREHPIKGISEFIHQLDQIAVTINKNIIVNIVGLHSDDFIHASESSLVNIKVNFKGALYGKEKDYEIFKSDCVAVPSKFESFSMVALEALSHNRPVLLSNMVGVKDDVDQCPIVFCYDLSSRSSLMKTIINLIRVKKEAIDINLDYFLMPFSKEAITVKINSLLKGKE